MTKLNEVQNNDLRHFVDVVEEDREINHRLWVIYDGTDNWLYQRGRMDYLGSDDSFIDGKNVVIFYEDAATVMPLSLAKLITNI